MHITTTANKVADFIVAKTPERRRSIVRQVMRAAHQEKGYAPYYSAFRTPAKDFLKGGANNPAILQRAIGRLPSRTGANPKWLAIDNRITKDALLALLQLGPRIWAQNVAFVTAPRGKATLNYPGITVTVTPDLFVHGERNGVPLFGAARFYLAKDYPYQLGRRGAELVATMEHLWCVQNATGARAPEASLCMVLECIQQRVTLAPDDISANAAAIERGCREFVAIWRQLSTEEAA